MILLVNGSRLGSVRHPYRNFSFKDKNDFYTQIEFFEANPLMIFSRYSKAELPIDQ